MGTLQGFLALLMVLIVSGEEVTVTAGVDESVLLPCRCEERNLSKDFKWQKNGSLVWRNKTALDGYTGRVEAFVNSSSRNCSLLLRNIKKDDNGKYECRFHKGLQYKIKKVVLTVYELNKPSQRNFSLSNGAMLFECNVKSRGDIDLQWTLDGKILRNSSSSKIFRNNTKENGIFNDTSCLEMNYTEFNSSSGPRCGVHLPQHGSQRTTKPPMTISHRTHYFVIPVLGFLLILCVLYTNSKRKK